MTLVGTIFLQSANFIDACYIVAFSLFIYGMSGLTGPADGGSGEQDRGGRDGDRGRRDAAHAARAERVEHAVADRAGVGDRDRGRGPGGADTCG